VHPEKAAAAPAAVPTVASASGTEG
jgi:hypothetical protein